MLIRFLPGLQDVPFDHPGDAAAEALVTAHSRAQAQAAAVALLAALLVDRLDREHEGQDERLVLVVGDLDGELLPDGELAYHPRDGLAAAADDVVAPVEMPAGLEPAEP